MRILDNMGLVQDPFHLGAVILDKLISDLKSKVPFLSKKRRDDDEGDEDSDEETSTETVVPGADDSDKTSVAEISDDDEEEISTDNSLIGKIKAKLTAFRKKKDVGIEEDTEASDAKPGKKKPNLIVIVGAILLIGFIFLSDFGDDQAPPADPAKMLKPRARKKSKPPEEKPVTPPETETSAVTTPETETPAVTTSETETPAVTTPETETPAVTTPETETPAVTTPESETPAVTTPTEGLPVETTPIETQPTDTNLTPPSSTDSVSGEDVPKTEDNLTDQILQDLENQAKDTEKKPVKTEYVSPPNYENVGRGLVYNCSGKHWACVDAPSYRNCEDNSSSNKFLKKKAECYPFNVYEAQSGCEKMQNRMVSSGAKTEFCAD